MGEHLFGSPRRVLLALGIVLGVAVVATAPLKAAGRTSFTVVPLVSDQPGVAPNTDPNLVNAWGLTSGPTTPWWVADNGTDKSTLYRGSAGPPQGTSSVVVADLNDDAIYKGLAIADTSAGPRLYAADFHNARVDVFDGSFTPVTGGFVDRSLPSGYAPFGIQTIGDRV